MANRRHLAKLKAGKESWNQWRANNPTVKPNLSGVNLRGKHLEGFDFSYANIRGTNFKEADLKGANFTEATAGLQKRWKILLIVLSLFFSAIAGFFSIWIAFIFFLLRSTDNTVSVMAGIIALIVLVIFLFYTLHKGLVTGAITGSGIVAVAVAVAGFVVGNNAIAIAVAAAGAVVGTGAIATAAAITFAIVVIIAGTEAITIVVAVAGVVVGTGAVPFTTTANVGTFGISVTIAAALLGTYLGWRSVRGDQRDPWIREFGVAFSTIGGTSFYDADLSSADFTKAVLKNSDLRAKSLTRSCWSSAEKLDLARLGNTILSQANVRDLLITRNGYQKSYQDANLRGANLAGFNLEQANLKYANLSEATLTNANLKDANLTEIQALGTDFTSAYLTGACLESWNIDHTTKLDNVDCQYIFLLENPNHLGSRERRPHDPERVFQPGDFTKLYQEVINTVEILLRKGANPEAFREAFQKLMADNPNINHDSIKGIEKKGEDVLLTLEVPDETDKAEVEHQFFETYETRLKAATEKARLEGKSEQQAEQIKDFKEILMGFSQNKSDNILQVHQENSPEKIVNKKINQNRSTNIKNSTVNASGAGSFNQGNIEGTVANNINHETDSKE